MDYTGALLAWTTKWDAYLWYSVPVQQPAINNSLFSKEK